MNRRIAVMLMSAVASAALLAFCSPPPVLAQTLTAQQQLAFDIYEELVEITRSPRLGIPGGLPTPWRCGCEPPAFRATTCSCSSRRRARRKGTRCATPGCSRRRGAHRAIGFPAGGRMM
jgi:hypothetical protein